MTDDELDTGFLDRSPPHWATRGLAYFLVGVSLLAAIGVVVVQIPETVTGRFTVVPEQGVDPVRALHDGVLSLVGATEGDPVQSGQRLFVIRSSPLGDRAADRQSLQAERSAQSARLAILASEQETRRRTRSGDRRRLESRRDYLIHLIDSKNRRLALARELADSAEVGARSGAVGRVEAARMALDAATLAEEIESARDDRDDSEAGIGRNRQDSIASELEFDQNRRALLTGVETAGIRIDALNRDLVNLSDSGMVVYAPCTGTVLRLGVRAAGAVVKDGEVLAEVACAGGRLQAALEVPQDGVALVGAGQPVKLRYDAFPYQRYGVRFGRVRWVGPAGAAERDAGFRALVDVTDTVVMVQGSARPLEVGMSGSADIVVGRRSLLSFAFEPLRALRESARGVP